jgi:hypothetical protein
MVRPLFAAAVALDVENGNRMTALVSTVETGQMLFFLANTRIAWDVLSQNQESSVPFARKNTLSLVTQKKRTNSQV